MDKYEKFGAFYLGKLYDPAASRPKEELLLYDSRDLTTHAVCVGMTGSGKTGLCITLLEEAAIDGIPTLAIDPKGDLGNLMLTFPQLRGADFRPWVDEGEAGRNGMTPDAYAADRAALWKKGLKGWQQDGTRIRRFRDAADVAIYTPGSSAGLPLSILRSFGAPPPAVRDDDDAMRQRLTASVSGLLALVGVKADPIRSREHILLSTILDRAWRAGEDLDLGALIQRILSPGFDKLGVMDLESFYPSKERFELSMLLNNLLASPGFASWMQGDAMDIPSLLHTPSGKPRISIFSIAHLPEEQRMFFVTLLLNEVIAWMRSQPGTGSLRAILYMDEVFGFLPPSANPPSKVPMLTLLKQARAYGVGTVLATQNPVDLDYKGLSNTGTWFIGRLQTERDKLRLIDGLEGAAPGGNFDRAKVEATISGLDKRVFLMNNVHDDEPALFHTRWALSYLRGPLTPSQIKLLMANRKAAPAAPGAAPAASAPSAPPAHAAAVPGTGFSPPILPKSIRQAYLPISRSIPAGWNVVYRPALLGIGKAHYVRVAAKVDDWRRVALLTVLDSDVSADPWAEADEFSHDADHLERDGDRSGSHAQLPGQAARPDSYKKWSKAFAAHVYRQRPLTILKCAALKKYSELGESERDFRVNLRQTLHEKRDAQIEKLRKRYAPKLTRLEERIRKSQQRIDREATQYKQQGFQTAVSLGTTVLGALFGRKKASVGNVGRAATTMRGAGRTASARGDVARAKQDLETARRQLADMEAEFEEAVERTTEEATVDQLEFEEIIVRPRKTDLAVQTFCLAWAPYRVSPDGASEAAF